MVASGKSCDGPEPKCGSKMLCGGLFGVSLLLGIIMFIVTFASTTCLCGSTYKNHEGGPACNGNNDSTCCIWGDESGCMTGGTKLLLWLVGGAFISAAWIFLCGLCACCCFAPEVGSAPVAPVAQAAPAAP
jgi:hypothetical protein